MTNRFSHITSQRRISDSLTNTSPQAGLKGKPEKKRIGREAFDTLLGLLAEDSESPTTPYGVLLANSTKRNLRKQIEDLFQP